ncbi:hypothetical protein IFO70_10120 [Phormidium tenue FACHB-886]|nr:hypothetical protein [Phormidium tenue FACHB-886]
MSNAPYYECPYCGDELVLDGLTNLWHCLERGCKADDFSVEELALLRASSPAPDDQHYDAEGNPIEWCVEHDAKVITDGQCFECLRGDRP